MIFDDLPNGKTRVLEFDQTEVTKKKNSTTFGLTFTKSAAEHLLRRNGAAKAIGKAILEEAAKVEPVQITVVFPGGDPIVFYVHGCVLNESRNREALLQHMHHGGPMPPTDLTISGTVVKETS